MSPISVIGGARGARYTIWKVCAGSGGVEMQEAVQSRGNFYSCYSHGLVRVAVVAPEVRVADPKFNGGKTIEMARKAHAEHAALVLFPELGLSAYSIDDLVQQSALLNAVEAELNRLRQASEELEPVIIAGAPLRADGRLFNAAVVVHRGEILGAVPKSYLPSYREFYERRHYSPGTSVAGGSISLCGRRVPFGTDLLFAASDLQGFVIGIEICEDLWVPTPPSSYAALAGATVIANLSASNATIAKNDYRHVLCRSHSGRCLAAYLYSAAGPGESTTDLAWDGQAMIYENGTLLAETVRFPSSSQMACADVDIELLLQERMRQNTFADCAREHRGRTEFRTVTFQLRPPVTLDTGLRRNVGRFPFVPDEPERLSELCFEAYNIQAQGLRQRLVATNTKKIVIGISGGLDSTQALLVAAKTFDDLGLPRSNILAYTLPAFATSSRTKSNAWALMRGLCVSATEIDMEPVSRQTLADIHHPFASGKKVYDVTFENVQAGARTATLFRLANMHDAIVLGTGDLSELALGWCTYGVGDHMSHYNVNASVSKTLIQHLIRWVADTQYFGADASHVMLDILDTEISPELVPGSSESGPAQKTEDFVGPYELQDLNLFYITRYGFAPSKVAYLAYQAWRDAQAGQWPPNIPQSKRRSYTLDEIAKWLELFLKRFFATSQFKRSALPNGPKVSSGGSLSPRGDWRAPSDSSAAVWLAELREGLQDALRPR